jgi:hypothetical protein
MMQPTRSAGPSTICANILVASSQESLISVSDGTGAANG